MRLPLKAAAIMLLTTMFVCTGVRRALAQEAAPNLRMLLNLDLFESRPRNIKSTPVPSAVAPDDSMLEQIRTLDAMGYLGNQPAADGDNPPSAPAGTPPSSSSSTLDVEGPQR
jgi:hypothetical protein